MRLPKSVRSLLDLVHRAFHGSTSSLLVRLLEPYSLLALDVSADNSVPET